MVQDATLRVWEDPCGVLTLTTRLTPQGPPSSYGDLATPCGQRFQVVPAAYRFRGATSAFCLRAAGGDPDLTSIILGCRRLGDDVTASINASAEWWGRPHREADLRATLRRCFPHFPVVWQEEIVHAVLTAPAKDLRCASPSPLVNCGPMLAATRRPGSVSVRSGVLAGGLTAATRAGRARSCLAASSAAAARC